MYTTASTCWHTGQSIDLSVLRCANPANSCGGNRLRSSTSKTSVGLVSAKGKENTTRLTLRLTLPVPEQGLFGFLRFWLCIHRCAEPVALAMFPPLAGLHRHKGSNAWKVHSRTVLYLDAAAPFPRSCFLRRFEIELTAI